MIKTYPNKDRYHEILKAMSSREKLEKSFELTEMANEVFWAGLKSRYPQLSEVELRRLYVQKLKECHNQSY
jgi:hypothetical protein